MKHLLTTTALVMLTALPMQAGQDESMGQTETKGQMDNQAQSSDPALIRSDMTLRASHLLGNPVYMREAGATKPGEMAEIAGLPQGWTRTGEIGDVILNRDGRIISVVMDVGGFLGIGEKQVKTGMDQLQFVRDANDRGHFFILYTGDRERLETQPAFDPAGVMADGEQRFSDLFDGSDKAGTKPDKIAAASAAEGNRLTAEAMEGAPVIGSTGDEIGEISRILLDDSGEMDAVVIDVGGFLGIGEKPVSLPYERLEVKQGGSQGALRVPVDYTQRELEQMPRWAG